MSTYYQVAARSPKGDVTHLGVSARKSLAGLRAFFTMPAVYRQLDHLGVYDLSNQRTEIVTQAAKPHPHIVTSSGFWLGFTGRTERDLQARRNPGELLVFGANPGGKLLGKLHQIRYAHETEGLREHDFDGDETIELLRDGSVRIYSPSGERLWTDR